MRKGLNATGLNNYLSCPIKYFYRNLVQIPSGYSAHMQYGNEMHSALEKFFAEGKKRGEIGSVERLLELFETVMKFSSLHEPDKKKYLKRGREALTAWYENRKADMKFDVRTEQTVSKDFALGSGEMLRLKGIIDKIEYLENEMEGPINIVDYKTGKPYSKKSKEQKEDLARQLTFYHILLDGYHEGKYRINQTMLDFVEPNEKGQSELQTLQVSDEDIVQLKVVIDTTAHEIMSAEFLNKGCQKKDCEWCALHASIQKK